MEPVRVTAQASAKINLVLSVGPQRADGYHDLATIFHAISLFDQLDATLAEDITVTVEGRQAGQVPTGPRNLAVQAARLLAKQTNVQAGAALHIRKAIPVAGGLAGGSADAAAALVACDKLWETGLAKAELMELAAQLGCDVPFALNGFTALGTGRGERLTEVLTGGTFHWVVAIAENGLSTPAVYGELDQLRGKMPVPAPDAGSAAQAALRTGDPEALAATLRNDLAEAACALEPALRRTLEVGRSVGALEGIVSGSGPTCVFLAVDRGHALDVAMGLTAEQVCADVECVTGPVPGARLVA